MSFGQPNSLGRLSWTTYSSGREDTGEEGRASFRYLVDNQVRLKVSANGFARNEYTLDAANGAADAITMILHRTAHVTIPCLDEDGAPIANRRVNVLASYDENETISLSSTTDENGLLVLETLPATDVSLELSFKRDGRTYRWASETPQLFPEEPAELSPVRFTAAEE